MEITHQTEIKCYVYLYQASEEDAALGIAVTTEAKDLEGIEGLISYRETTITYPGIIPVEEPTNAAGNDDSTNGGPYTYSNGADTDDSEG